jgi:hypothetical protein
MADLRRASVRSAGYPQAFAAQMLNQQLFFHHFPGSQAEAVRRIEALLARIRAERPGMFLLVSAVPSYQLVLGEMADPLLSATVSRLPITVDGGRKQEQELYGDLRAAAERSGWYFVDNLTALQALPNRDRLYNHFDYHIEPSASRTIGRLQAEALLALRNHNGR